MQKLCILALAAALIVAPSGWALSLERGDEVVVNQPVNCGSGRNFVRQWEGTVIGPDRQRGPSFVRVKPDQSWCRVPYIAVWKQRVKPVPKARPDCP